MFLSEARKYVEAFCQDNKVNLTGTQAFAMCDLLVHISKIAEAEANGKVIKIHDRQHFVEKFPGVINLIANKEKIKAIKLLRNLTGHPLKESKALIDDYIYVNGL